MRSTLLVLNRALYQLYCPCHCPFLGWPIDILWGAWYRTPTPLWFGGLWLLLGCVSKVIAAATQKWEAYHWEGVLGGRRANHWLIYIHSYIYIYKYIPTFHIYIYIYINIWHQHTYKHTYIMIYIYICKFIYIWMPLDIPTFIQNGHVWEQGVLFSRQMESAFGKLVQP